MEDCVYAIYAVLNAILIHIYDTSTDIAVLTSWGILAAREINGVEDYKNVNMLSLFVPALLVIFVYRIAYLSFYMTLNDSMNTLFNKSKELRS